MIRMRRALLALVAAGGMVVASGRAPLAGTPTYSIDFAAISAGAGTLRGTCYTLSGTLGQAAPGYSSGGVYAVFAGYWPPGVGAPSAAVDAIFFNSFEEC